MENNHVNVLAADKDENEIVESLKRFGVTSAYKIETEGQKSLQDIMQDFELNELVFKEVEKKKPNVVRRSYLKKNFNNFLFFENINMKNSFKKIYKNGKYSTSYESCVFCLNNNEPEAVYRSHSVRDCLGKVLCPKLRTYVCPICGASGDTAHTVKYCPHKPIITMEDTIKYEYTRVTRTAFVKQEVKY